MVVSCTNDTLVGILGAFYARIEAKHSKTGQIIESRSMVYVMDGASVLLSRKTLQEFGCISPNLLEAGQFKNVNLAHMRSSKEVRQSQKLVRGDQGFSYQVSSNG